MTNFNCDIFCERVNSLFGSMGQMELSEKIGISQGVISAIKNKKVKAPGADTIFRIANFFNVSADYLLGISDIPTQNAELKAVCEYTGLSQKAIEKILEVKQEEEINELESTLRTFSSIIENENFWRIVLQLNSATDYIEFLDTNPTHMMKMAINRLNGQEIISNENRKLLSFINLNGLEPLFKQELAETIWQLFDEVVKQEDAKET
ncbi:MAG: helix-turn-helix transcriptional regulator [Ruminococcaceae bacterium]|nr:helix-turn-helix transcriptional regulator [Oscillospiraceae bacterium]